MDQVRPRLEAFAAKMLDGLARSDQRAKGEHLFLRRRAGLLRAVGPATDELEFRVATDVLDGRATDTACCPLDDFNVTTTAPSDDRDQHRSGKPPDNATTRPVDLTTHEPYIHP
jgi:hypothetical protein